MMTMVSQLDDAITPDVNGDVSLSPDAFKAAFRNHAAGVALVTADPGDSPVAMTVSSLASISATPALLMFSASALSSSTPILDRCDTVVIHMLSAEQLWLAQLGATSGIDRFADTQAWSRLSTGEPVFHGAFAWLRGRVRQRLIAGASVVYIVEALEASPARQPADRDVPPLVYYNRTWHALGPASVIA